MEQAADTTGVVEAIDIIGIGGAGGLLASALIQVGVSPRIVSRGAALRQLRSVGLTIVSGEQQSVYRPIVSSSLDDIQQFAPLVLLTTKSYDIPAVLDEIAPRLPSNALLVTVQNGFAAYDTVRAMFGAEKTAMGVLYVGAHILSPGVIEIKPGVAQLLLPSEHQDRLATLASALKQGRVDAALVDDIERRMWMKQLFLVPFAILNAELHQPVGVVRADAQARARWAALAEEIARIARAEGIPMPDDAASASLSQADRFDPQAHSSFARDVWANRPHEAAALIGPLLQRAAKHHLDCPLLQQAYDYYVK
jgi:2-dehydropantoate 2-reductase